MKKKIAWALGCLLIGAAVIPLTQQLQWSMRSRFILRYDVMKRDCERVSHQVITPSMEESAEAVLAENPELAREHYCRDLLTDVAQYRQAARSRSIGFGVVVAISLLVVRFLMIPFRNDLDWQSGTE